MVYTIYEEYRLIEQSEGKINRAWKGAHLLLFVLAFVFGSFCTFCFHMLMYLFDEKCVLFPKLLSLTSQRHNVIYEFIPTSDDLSNLPVDFVSTQWVDKRTCELPTYVPLVSGIFGLVWTTMFLMCSTGSRSLTGLQRQWRVLPPVLIFSVLMSILCIYSSINTHNGLEELCIKLGELTGSTTCTYTVNVATLVYERRIRGVYQATRLTILTAWLHTLCWIGSAVLIIVRIILVVDFQLVRVNVSIKGDIDKLLERNETQIRSVMPDYAKSSDGSEPSSSNKKESVEDDKTDPLDEFQTKPRERMLELNDSIDPLIPELRKQVDLYKAYSKINEKHQFIVDILYKFVDSIKFPETPKTVVFSNIDTQKASKSAVVRGKGTLETSKSVVFKDIDTQETSKGVELRDIDTQQSAVAVTTSKSRQVAEGIMLDLIRRFERKLNLMHSIEAIPSTSNEMRELYAPSDAILLTSHESSTMIMPTVKKEDRVKKSNLRQVSTQTGLHQSAQRTQKHVIITESTESTNKVDDDTQTTKKDKQD